MALLGREREGKEVGKVRKEAVGGSRRGQAADAGEPLGGAREPPIPPGKEGNLLPLSLLLDKRKRPLPLEMQFANAGICSTAFCQLA